MTTNAKAAQAQLPSHPWLTGKIVVGVDGSESSRRALRHASQLAGITGARIEAISVWQHPVGYGFVWPMAPFGSAEQTRAMLQEVITSTFGGHIPNTFSAGAWEGESATVLLEASRDADLLVVGSRGHGGFAGLLLGSVSTKCAEHAQCPVLVVHDSGARLARP